MLNSHPMHVHMHVHAGEAGQSSQKVLLRGRGQGTGAAQNMLHTFCEVSRANDSGRHYVSRSHQRTHCNTSSYQGGRPEAWNYVHSKLVHSWLVARGNIHSRLTGRVWAAHHARHAPHTPPPPVQCRAVREHGWLASEGTGGTW